jgi:hypothetical protein
MTVQADLDFDPRNLIRSLLQTAWAVVASPQAFFRRMRKEGGFSSPLIFLLICLLVHTGLAALIRRDPSLIGKSLLFGMLFPFITAAIIHLVITRIYRAGGTYEAAFRVNAYCSAVNLLTWFPGVGLLLEFYRLYLITVGLSAVFKIGTMRALLAIVITIGTYMASAGALRLLGGG